MDHQNGRRTVGEIYHFIQEHLYFNRPDLEVKGKRYNSTLLFSLLTGLNGGKALIIGEPGLGKTTSAEYVCSLLYQLPIGLIWGSEVPGHPEQTEEKIVGRPDLGKLNRGIEEVVWSNFSQLSAKIVDEINRLPETKQSVILDAVDRGNWEYLNEMIINEEYCLFATANYQDVGTNTLIPPLIDRFDVMVESKHPGPNLSLMVGMHSEKDHMLRSPNHEISMQQVLKSKTSYTAKQTKLEEICTGFGDRLRRQFGVDTLSREARGKAQSEIRDLSFDIDADAFTRTVLAELSFCFQYGQKRSDETCVTGCHYTGYLCYATKNCASNRLPTSIRRYAQALAWLSGADEVDLEHVRAVMPHALAHRVQWKDEYVAKRRGDKRADPFEIYLARRRCGRYSDGTANSERTSNKRWQQGLRSLRGRP